MTLATAVVTPPKNPPTPGIKERPSPTIPPKEDISPPPIAAGLWNVAPTPEITLVAMLVAVLLSLPLCTFSLLSLVIGVSSLAGTGDGVGTGIGCIPDPPTEEVPL